LHGRSCHVSGCPYLRGLAASIKPNIFGEDGDRVGLAD
jgi:hypothetical protein